MKRLRLAYILTCICFASPFINSAQACSNLPPPSSGFIEIRDAIQFYNIRSCAVPDDLCGLRISENFKIMNDIDFSAQGFTNFEPFPGCFSGQLVGASRHGIKLKHFNINRTLSSSVGMFEVLDGATIRDLIFEDVNVQAKSFVAAISPLVVGASNISHIKFTTSSPTSLCQVRAVHSATNGTIDGGDGAGLIATDVIQTDTTPPVISAISVEPARDSNNTGACQVSASYGSAGGIVGSMTGGRLTRIAIRNLVVSGRSRVGGVAAEFLDVTSGWSNVIEDSRIDAIVQTLGIPEGSPCVTSSGSIPCSIAGGLLGQSNSMATIARSSTSGQVKSFYLAGGLVGQSANPNLVILNSLSTSSVTQLQAAQGYTTPQGAIGGLTGLFRGTIIDSYSANTALNRPITQTRIGGLIGCAGTLPACSGIQTSVSCPSIGACSYYDRTLVGDLGSSYGIALSTPQMQSIPTQQDSPFGMWEASVWHLASGSYPQLLGRSGSGYCGSDANDDGSISLQDVFDYLYLYFNQDLRGDLDGNGNVTLQDLFIFLALWFSRAC